VEVIAVDGECHIFRKNVKRVIYRLVMGKYTAALFVSVVNRRSLSVVDESSPVTGREWPRGFQEVKVPRFHDNGTGCW